MQQIGSSWKTLICVFRQPGCVSYMHIITKADNLVSDQDIMENVQLFPCNNTMTTISFAFHLSLYGLFMCSSSLKNFRSTQTPAVILQLNFFLQWHRPCSSSSWCVITVQAIDQLNNAIYSATYISTNIHSFGKPFESPADSSDSLLWKRHRQTLLWILCNSAWHYSKLCKHCSSPDVQ